MDKILSEHPQGAISDFPGTNLHFMRKPARCTPNVIRLRRRGYFDIALMAAISYVSWILYYCRGVRPSVVRRADHTSHSC